jgi:hypothetical protein
LLERLRDLLLNIRAKSTLLCDCNSFCMILVWETGDCFISSFTFYWTSYHLIFTSIFSLCILPCICLWYESITCYITWYYSFWFYLFGAWLTLVKWYCLLFFIITRWLRQHKKLQIYVEPRVKVELLSESSYFNFIDTWSDGKQSNIWCHKRTLFTWCTSQNCTASAFASMLSLEVY